MTLLAADPGMQPLQRMARPFAAISSLRFSTVIFYLFILSDLLIRSRMYEFVSDAFRTAMLAFVMGVLVSSALIAFFRSMMLQTILFFCFSMLFLWEIFHFALLNGTGVNINTMGQLYGPLSFIFFCNFEERDLMRNFGKAVFLFGSIYLFFYCFLAILNVFGSVPRVVLERLAVNDPSRGIRVFLAGDTAAMIFFLCLTGAVQTLPRRVMIFIASLAMALSLSRFFLFLMTVSFICYKLRIAKVIPIFFWFLFLAESALMIYGIFDPAFNPFSFFKSDSSGWARSVEFDLARNTIWRDFISGVGFPSSDADLAYAVSSTIYSTSDIGAVNVWSVFGLFGLLLFFFTGIPLSRAFVGDPDDRLKMSFHLVSCLILGLNTIAPLSLINPGSLVFGCAFAAWMARNKRERPRKPQEQYGRTAGPFLTAPLPAPAARAAVAGRH